MSTVAPTTGQPPVPTGSTPVSRLRYIDAGRTRLPVRRRLRSRGVPNALADHPVAFAADPREAGKVTTQLLGGCLVTPERGFRKDFHFAFHAISFLDVTMSHLDYAVPTHLDVARSADAYTVHVAASGRGCVTLGAERHELSPFTAVVVSPGTSYRMTLEQDSPQLVVRIERPALERELSRLLGRSLPEPVVFEPLCDLTADTAARWHGAISILSSEVMAAGSLLQQGVGAGAVEALVISTLLYMQRSNYSEALRDDVVRGGRPVVRRCLDYIEQHLAEPIGLDDLAAYTSLSPRSIQVGFREDLHTTPTAYIRDQRLDRVRRTLLSALPGDGVTVTEVAQRWGFAHLGKFSVVYRRQYGERPSQTLRRQVEGDDA